MRQRQLFAIQRNLVIVDEVDVDDAGSPALGGYATKLDLERLDPLEQRLRREAGEAKRASIDEPVLIGLAPRGGAVEARDGGELKSRLAGDRPERPTQAQGLVADIAAEREHDPRPAVVFGHSCRPRGGAQRR